MRNELVDLALFIIHETDAAWRVSDTGKDADGVWLPKSQVEVEFDKAPKAGVRAAVVTLPTWLAQEKELV